MKIAFIIWLLLLSTFSVLPDSNSGVIQLTFYKLTSSGFFLHLLSFFIAALLCFKAFKHGSLNLVFTSGVLLFLYSILLESIQVFLPYRTFNYFDILANSVGIGLGIIIFVYYPKFMLKCKI
jgi:glycopeptide antibiotics resistance protein